MNKYVRLAQNFIQSARNVINKVNVLITSLVNLAYIEQLVLKNV